MRRFGTLAKQLMRDRRAATAVEYGLILALVFVAIAGSIAGVADATSGIWGNVNDRVEEVM